MTSPARSSVRWRSLLGALAELPVEEAFLLSARYGIGGEQQSEAKIAARLGITRRQLAEMEEQALTALGLFLLAGAGAFESPEGSL